jgi:hypothetical protein
VRPDSIPGGNPTSDQELWDTLEGDGVGWSGCEYAKSAVTNTLSYLICDASSPTLDRRLGFEYYATAREVRTEIAGYANLFTGTPGTCEGGGRFTGTLLGRDVACGWFTFKDGSTGYYIVWTKSDGLVFASASDADPARTWQWFLEHDPF